MQTLRAFEAAARLLSFTAAAAELNITQSAISQQIRLLEHELGATLFDRRTRRLVLTRSGVRFATAAKRAITLIAEAAHEIGHARRVSELAIATIPSFASRWLVPRLPEFQARHPIIEVSVFPAFEPHEIELSDADLGILLGDGSWRGYRTEKLATETVFPICRPEIAAKLKEPEDLFQYTLLRDADARHEYWPDWLAEAGTSRQTVTRGPRFDNLSDMVAAALDGQGIGLVRSAIAEAELKTGRLVRPFALEVPARYSLYLVWAKRPANRAAALAFRDWLRPQVETIPGPPSNQRKRPVSSRRSSKKS
jgi:LysR family transcriptional regulator, glycine cleavage system transcriptional activator